MVESEIAKRHGQITAEAFRKEAVSCLPHMRRRRGVIGRVRVHCLGTIAQLAGLFLRE
jgi:hypothetical protein